MINYTKLAGCLKREILNFSKKVCKGLKKPEFKLITNMFYGISESKSCHLSKISRTLKEPITLKKTIERLSCGLRDFSEKKGKLHWTTTTKSLKAISTTEQFMHLTDQTQLFFHSILLGNIWYKAL